MKHISEDQAWFLLEQGMAAAEIEARRKAGDLKSVALLQEVMAIHKALGGEALLDTTPSTFDEAVLSRIPGAPLAEQPPLIPLWLGKAMVASFVLAVVAFALLGPSDSGSLLTAPQFLSDLGADSGQAAEEMATALSTFISSTSIWIIMGSISVVFFILFDRGISNRLELR